jgi:hypothetical protein
VPLLLLVAGMVYAVLGGVAGSIAVLVGSLCSLICVVGGVVTMVAGGAQYRRLTAQLDSWPRPLPTARVVERRLPAGDELPR